MVPVTLLGMGGGGERGVVKKGHDVVHDCHDLIRSPARIEGNQWQFIDIHIIISIYYWLVNCSTRHFLTGKNLK